MFLNNLSAQNECNIIFCTCREKIEFYIVLNTLLPPYNTAIWYIMYLVHIHICRLRYAYKKKPFSHSGSNIQSTWISWCALRWCVWKVGRGRNGSFYTNWFFNIYNQWWVTEICTGNGSFNKIWKNLILLFTKWCDTISRDLVYFRMNGQNHSERIIKGAIVLSTVV